MLYKEAISSRLLAVLQNLMVVNELKAFRLVGGTALALQLGHRESVDIDLFSYKDFAKQKLGKRIAEKFHNMDLLREGEKSLSFHINNSKVDLWALDVPFIRPEITEENIRMADKEDIAAMKLNAITDRATKKDYYDIAELLNNFTFKELLGFYAEKYPHKTTRNVIDVIKEIPFRNRELEQSPPPKTFRNITWNDVKKKVFTAFDTFRNDELNEKIEEMKKRK
ncbi:MAG: nucleotidyl transferase AbiEii/AbiGii toxin family protein [Bacteroidetes bacterium]|nr:nucleotidyl transferase AbiEii/AbiGii toxin family protein [Bacteroidota bacterium]